MEGKSTIENAALDPYDAVPYGGRTVPLSHPDRLALSALRHGMSPAPAETCRVLELGCAEGANVVPMAYYLERARFVAVDASTTELAMARESAARLGLENLELVHARIESLDHTIGQFDYIVAHGVLSWVSDDVRDRMLALIGEHLAPNGVAYVSFNCAPGWSIRSEIRRALVRGVETLADPREKLVRARELLSMMVRSPVRETPYGTLLAAEAERALARRDGYLMHEYLEEENRAFYFGEVVELARAHGLVLFDELGVAVADARIERGLVSGFAETFGDVVRAEELTELLLFRGFRMALFRRADAPVSEDGSATRASILARARFAGPVRPDSARLSLDPGVHEIFLTAQGARVGTSSALLKAALIELGKSWPRGLAIVELLERAALVLAMRRVIDAPEAIEAGDREALANDLIELGALGHLAIRLREPAAPTSSIDAPRVAALTRLEAERSHEVTTPLHDVVALDPLGRRLVRYLDGTRTQGELVVIARGLVQSQELVLSDDAGQELAPERVEPLLPDLVRRSIEALAARNILV